MSSVSAKLGAVAAVLRRDVQVFRSYRLRFTASVIASFFTLTLFYYVSRLVGDGVFASADAYYAYAVVGLVVLEVLYATLIAPPDLLRQELVAGTFERLVVSPFGPLRTLVSMLVFPFALALLVGLCMLAIGALVYGIDVRWSTAALGVPFAVLGSLAFLSFGLLLLALILVVKQAAQATSWVVFGIAIIAGLYFPVTLLPGWVEWASDAQPFTPAVDLLRNVLVTLPLAVWLLARALRFSQRRGTIIEY